jgi:hypothetical protein
LVDGRQRTVVGRGVVLFEGADPLEELLCAPLLKQAHQRAPQRLGGIARDLGHGRTDTSALLDIAAGYLAELEIASHVGRHEDVCKLAVGHDELGDEVDVPIVGAAVLLPWLGAGGEVAVFFEKLSRERGHAAEEERTCSRLTEAASLAAR